MGRAQIEKAEGAIADLSATLDRVEGRVVLPPRFEETRFYCILKGLVYTAGKRAVITLEVTGSDLENTVALKDAWQVPLICGLWRQ